MKNVYLVGKYISGEFPNIIWEVDGVYSNKKLAIKACKNENYFYAKFIVNEQGPEDTVILECVYPKYKEKTK